MNASESCAGRPQADAKQWLTHEREFLDHRRQAAFHLRMETGGGDEHADGPGLWSAGRIIERFRKEFGSLECRDNARPFDSVEELETFMGSSSTCEKALDWCAAVGSELIGRG
jgi:hypothetical protein